MKLVARIIISVAVLVTGASLSGCNESQVDTITSANTEHTPATLVDTYWKLTAISELDMLPAGLSFEPHMVLTHDGIVKGHSGCNRFFGGYLLENDALSFKEVAATRMACPDVASIEFSFHKALKEAGSYRIDGDNLYLETVSGINLATFTAAEPAQQNAQL